MALSPTYPGVYIQEIPSGVRTIAGVATSVAAFVDNFSRGPLNEPVQIFSMADFEREFGGLHVASEASYAVQQFFLNGGQQGWVVRVASGAFASAAVEIQAGIGGATALAVEAHNPGDWGNHLVVGIDYPEPVSGDRFTLSVTLNETRNGRNVVVASEVFRNLTMAVGPRFVETVVNDELTGSKLIRVTASGLARPQPTGTLSGALAPFPALTSVDPQFSVTIGSEGTAVARLAAVPTTLTEARAQLEAAIRAARPASRAFAQATVSVVDDRLRVRAGPSAADARVTFGVSGADPAAADLGLLPGQSLQGVLSDDVAGAFAHPGGQLRVTIGATGPLTLTLPAMADLAAARTALEAQIRAADPAPAFTDARVLAHSDGGVDRLLVLAGTPANPVSITPEGADTTAADLALDGAAATAVVATLSDDLNPVPTVNAGSVLAVTIGGDGPHTATTTANANTIAGLATELQTAVRAANPANPATFTGTVVAAYDANGENRLAVLAGTAGDAVVFAGAPADATTVTELLLDAANAQANVQSYALGFGAAIPNTAQGAGAPGAAGDPPIALDLIGSLAAKTGINALENVDLFNILCLPRVSVVSGSNALSDVDAAAVIAFATTYCENRRAFFVIDTPNNIDEVAEIRSWAEANATLRHRNTAVYFPRVQIPDPLNGFRLRSVGASGTMAGVYARTDGSRGVWKAPAGTEARLTNVQRLDELLTDAENGALNPLGINCLRNFPLYGNVAWGARTLEGSDDAGSEWKYVPVRRLALFLEESLYRGTQWVVFEPNDEPLWAQIRLNVGAFMHDLFRQGAFQGRTPQEAYLVKCDKETTTQNDINRGIVNILVGFAPLKPAEFVIIQIQQLAGQIQT
jgi:phage tail sheath protein FI